MTISTALEALDGPRQAPASGGAPTALVILLHGLGADGNDLIGLAPAFGQILPDAVFVSPHAPFPCDMAPMGRQWFSFSSQADADILAGARTVAPVLDTFIDDELMRYGLSEDRLALVGFSQGTMMALHVALRRPIPCASVVGYSGALIAPEILADEINCRPPVMLVHGEADEVILFSAMASSTEVLRNNGVPVHCEARAGLGHGIDEQGMAFGAATLKQTLGA
ncbi:MAG: alpha/beta hydrolase [Alphaproteobacteria bacterium]